MAVWKPVIYNHIMNKTMPVPDGDELDLPLGPAAYLFADRGVSPDAQIVWSELDNSWQAGTVGNMVNLNFVPATAPEIQQGVTSHLVSASGFKSAVNPSAGLQYPIKIQLADTITDPALTLISDGSGDTLSVSNISKADTDGIYVSRDAQAAGNAITAVRDGDGDGAAARFTRLGTAAGSGYGILVENLASTGSQIGAYIGYAGVSPTTSYALVVGFSGPAGTAASVLNSSFGTGYGLDITRYNGAGYALNVTNSNTSTAANITKTGNSSALSVTKTSGTGHATTIDRSSSDAAAALQVTNTGGGSGTQIAAEFVYNGSSSGSNYSVSTTFSGTSSGYALYGYNSTTGYGDTAYLIRHNGVGYALSIESTNNSDAIYIIKDGDNPGMTLEKNSGVGSGIVVNRTSVVGGEAIYAQNTGGGGGNQFGGFFSYSGTSTGIGYSTYINRSGPSAGNALYVSDTSTSTGYAVHFARYNTGGVLNIASIGVGTAINVQKSTAGKVLNIETTGTTTEPSAYISNSTNGAGISVDKFSGSDVAVHINSYNTANALEISKTAAGNTGSGLSITTAANGAFPAAYISSSGASSNGLTIDKTELGDGIRVNKTGAFSGYGVRVSYEGLSAAVYVTSNAAGQYAGTFQSTSATGSGLYASTVGGVGLAAITASGGSNGAIALDASVTGASTSYALKAAATSGSAIYAESSGNTGIVGKTLNAAYYGVIGQSSTVASIGRLGGNNSGVSAVSSEGYGVRSTASGSALFSGYFDTSGAITGIRSDSVNGHSIVAITTGSGQGLNALSATNYGVYGKTQSATSYGVIGYAANGTTYGALGGNTYAVYANGNVFSTGSYLPSDERLKDNIVQITNAREKILLMRGVYYMMKEGTLFYNSKQVRQAGVIAQEMIKIAPEVIGTLPNPAIMDPSEPAKPVRKSRYPTPDASVANTATNPGAPVSSARTNGLGVAPSDGGAAQVTTPSQDDVFAKETQEYERQMTEWRSICANNKTKRALIEKEYLVAAYERLTPFLIEGFKEQDQLITDLMARVDALEKA